MTKIFEKIDKIKPAFDIIYQLVLKTSVILLIVDILITSFAVAGRLVPAIPDPAWNEELILTCMAYMAVLSAALAIRTNNHIRMTAFDKYLPKKVIFIMDILADVAVLSLGFVMLIVGWKYAIEIGTKGFYVSMPSLSRFWMYFPIPVAGAVMIFFEIEKMYGHLKNIFITTESKDNEVIL